MFRLNYLQTADIVDRSSEKLYGVLVHVFRVSDQMLILTPRVFFYLFFFTTGQLSGNESCSDLTARNKTLVDVYFERLVCDCDSVIVPTICLRYLLGGDGLQVSVRLI